MFVILFRARGRLPPGAPGRPSYKGVGDAPRKIRIRDWRPVQAWFRLLIFWPLNLGNKGLFIFTEIFLDIAISLCKSIFRPDLPRKSKNINFYCCHFFSVSILLVYGCKNAHFSYHSTVLCYLGFAVLFTHDQKPDSSILVSLWSVRDKINLNQDTALIRPIALFAPFVYTANENLCSQGIVMRV